MKLMQLVHASNSLQYVANLKLPVVKSFKVAALLKKLSPELEAWEAKRQELSAEHTDGNGKFNSEEAGKQFNASMQELLATEVDVVITQVLDRADLKSDAFKAAPLASLYPEFFNFTLGEVQNYELSLIAANNAFNALTQLGNLDLPAAVADLVLTNLISLRETMKSFVEQEEEIAKSQNIVELQKFQTEVRSIPGAPIKVDLFGDTELEPALLLALEHLIVE